MRIFNNETGSPSGPIDVGRLVMEMSIRMVSRSKCFCACSPFELSRQPLFKLGQNHVQQRFFYCSSRCASLSSGHEAR